MDGLTPKPPIDFYETWPKGLEDVALRDIRQVLPRPSLIRIAGDAPQPLFLSILLHGNEATSFLVLQALARQYRSKTPARSLLIFVGNVYAAEQGVRTLPGQIDYNRIWGDPLADEASEFGLSHLVLSTARREGLFASIDIHNTTGRNPAYGCVTAMRAEDMGMARLFSDICVFYQNPPTTQSIAFSKLCPALIVECGQSGDTEGLEAAIRLVEDMMALTELPYTVPGDLKLYETIGRVTLPQDKTIELSANDQADIQLSPDAEDWNFQTLPSGTPFLKVHGQDHGVLVVDEHGHDLTSHFLEYREGALVLKRDVVPAMITTCKNAILADCLCYLMREL